jgi:hypothetical protein
VVQKRFIVLLGVFLGSHAPAVAQSAAPQIALTQVRVAPARTSLPTVSTPLTAASFLLSQDPGRSSAGFSILFARADERDRSLPLLPPTEELKTVFFTHSSLPLAQLWGGRLRLNAFQSTLHLQIVQIGPQSYRGTQGLLSTRQGCAGDPSSAGLSLNFHFGRDARTGHPSQAMRRMTRFVGAVLE